MTPLADGKLIALKVVDLERGTYFAREPSDPGRDILMPLSTLITQHLSFPGTAGPLAAIESDIGHACALLETYRLITSHAGDYGGVDQLIETQLESLFVLIRQIYDQLHKLSLQVARRTIRLDGSGRSAITNLPKSSFAKMVLVGERLRSADELVEAYGLPLPLARFYEASGPTFKRIRNLRVSVEHHGKNIESIFLTEKGAAVLIEDALWSEMARWDETSVFNNKFGSVRAIYAQTIQCAMILLDNYAQAVRESIQLPEPLGEGVSVYLRNPLGSHLVSLPETLLSPWEGDLRGADPPRRRLTSP